MWESLTFPCAYRGGASLRRGWVGRTLLKRAPKYPTYEVVPTS